MENKEILGATKKLFLRENILQELSYYHALILDFCLTCGSCFCNSFQVQYLKDVFNPQFIRKIEAKGKRGIQLPQNDLWTLPLVVFSWPSQLLFNSENSCLFCCLIKYIPTFWEKQLINNFNLPPPTYYFSPISFFCVIE